jgi:hypothetical protein
MQQCLFDAAIFISNALHIQEPKGFDSPNARANRLLRVRTGLRLGCVLAHLACFKHSKTQRFHEPEGWCESTRCECGRDLARHASSSHSNALSIRELKRFVGIDSSSLHGISLGIYGVACIRKTLKASRIYGV